MISSWPRGWLRTTLAPFFMDRPPEMPVSGAKSRLALQIASLRWAVLSPFTALALSFAMYFGAFAHIFCARLSPRWAAALIAFTWASFFCSSGVSFSSSRVGGLGAAAVKAAVADRPALRCAPRAQLYFVCLRMRSYDMEEPFPGVFRRCRSPW